MQELSSIHDKYHILLGAIRDRAFDAGLDGFDDRRMAERRLGGTAEPGRERVRLFGDDVEPEGLDGDEAIARGFVGAKDGTESANTNLMQHPEGTECRRRRESAGVLSGQRKNSSGGSRECNTDRGILRRDPRV